MPLTAVKFYCPLREKIFVRFSTFKIGSISFPP